MPYATDESGFHPLRGVVRTFGVLLLVYAILREQLLGIDLKVRWGISKGTVAAVFIAVFFVASEAAQQFLGAALQNEYVGIFAAGMLVFALAPLSRAADRIAEKAVPAPAGLPANPPAAARAPRQGAADPEASYRHALRWALRDGSLDAAEERHLVVLAEHLGIPPSRAYALRDEAASEVDR
jgi:hypothetical protein